MDCGLLEVGGALQRPGGLLVEHGVVVVHANMADIGAPIFICLHLWFQAAALILGTWSLDFGSGGPFTFGWIGSLGDWISFTQLLDIVAFMISLASTTMGMFGIIIKTFQLYLEFLWDPLDWKEAVGYTCSNVR